MSASSHRGYDRILFEFDGPTPGYDAAYVTEPLKNDDTGAPIPVDGSSVLTFQMTKAASADIGAAGVRETYTGPKRFRPSGTPVVSELVQIRDFEGTLSWAIGLRRPAPFKVRSLGGPSRLVIDFQS